MSDSIPELIVRKTAVAVLDMDPSVLVATAAEGADGSGFALEFQRATRFDEQDRLTGMDTYCVCTSEGATHYGGIKATTFGDDVVELTLHPDASRLLHIPGRFRLRLDVPAQDRAAFLETLRSIIQVGATRF